MQEQERALHFPDPRWSCLLTQDWVYQCLLLQADHVWKERGKLIFFKVDAIFSTSREKTLKLQLSPRLKALLFLTFWNTQRAIVSCSFTYLIPETGFTLTRNGFVMCSTPLTPMESKQWLMNVWKPERSKLSSPSIWISTWNLSLPRH